jgi:hypothetical protein
MQIKDQEMAKVSVATVKSFIPQAVEGIKKVVDEAR